jgi:hypothetical protein
MGMTIDDADTILSCERLDSSMGCGASDEDIDKALGVAIDTMRKYQKIVQIMERTVDDGTSMYDTLEEIEEVVEDGNVDQSNSKEQTNENS